MKTLIRNANVVIGGQTERMSVLIADTKIVDIDSAIHTEAVETIDAEGLYLIPGVIDDQVHFREPGLTHKEDLEHASRACAKGGVTTFLEMPNTIPNATTCEKVFDKLALAAEKSRVNYGFYIGATPDNLDELKKATRTPGIKIFIGSSTGDLLVDDQNSLEQIFAETALPICAHCEDETTVRLNMERFAGTSNVADHSRIRDHRAAWIATERATDLARRHKHPFHVLHVSTAQELALLVDHENVITAEACPHHLFFNVEDYDRLGSLIQMNPSIKTLEDNMALWDALIDGTIQVVATDHAPHTLEEKQQPYPQSPSGLPAVENSLSLMLSQVNQNRATIEQVVHWMCEAPARVWNMIGKGKIEVGFDADLVLVDMNRKSTILNQNQLTKCGWSPWHNDDVTGVPVRTIVMGKTVYQNNGHDEHVFDDVRGSEVEFDPSLGGYWGV